MGRSGKTKAARDQRKQKKAQRRKARQGRRAASTGAWALVPKGPWRPTVEGIEGWAHRELVEFWQAARALDRRADLAPEVWTPSRVGALATEELVEHLARFGVQTEQTSFRALSDTYRAASAIVLHAWSTPMPARAVDRDLLKLATRELYRRWVDRWSCLEDIDDLWVDGLADDATPYQTLTRSVRVAEALRPHCAEPGVALSDILGSSPELQGWFVTLLDEAEAMAAEDPAVARVALPALEFLADNLDGDAFDRVDVLRALATVMISCGEPDLAEERLLGWSDARASCEGAVALTEAWGAYEVGCTPERRRDAVIALVTAQEKRWAALDELQVASRIDDIQQEV